MNKKLERILILFIDFISINTGWLLYFYFKVQSGLFDVISSPDFLIPMFIVYVFWLMIFITVGMYRTWFAASRLEELTTLFKTTAVGIFILFFIIMYDDYVNNIQSSSRFLIFVYWILLLISAGAGRLIVRSIQRNLLTRGIGRRKALIIGFNKKGNSIHDSIDEYRALGIDVAGYIAVNEDELNKEHKNIKVTGTVDNVDTIVKNNDIKQIIFALDHHDEEILFNVIDKCEGLNLSFKIMPDLYSIISGQARVSQIYGFPLIDIMPQLMPEWEKTIKRMMDITVSTIFLIFTFPVTLITSIIVKLESEGPVLYSQERVGMNGRPIKIYKFRSMVKDAEKKSGPVWASQNDPRITKVGAFLRKTRIDEIPQMINVLKGEMSLVGPRPERAFFVEKLSKEIPLYKRRLSVRPGLTGWAQVKHKYDESIDDVKTKLKYDLYYIENMSIRMDINIMLRTVLVVLFGKGQ